MMKHLKKPNAERAHLKKMYGEQSNGATTMSHYELHRSSQL